MGKKQDRIKIVNKIKAAAVLYKQKLIGKKFIYIFDGRYIEVIYKAESFRHLTGVETKLSAKQFYKYAINGKLTASQIYFSPTHPFKLCVQKIKHIEDIASIPFTGCFILEDIKTNTTSYKFAATNMNCTLCMNKEFDQNRKEKNECYVVQSLRDGDCFSKSGNVYVVTHIFSKRNDKKLYSDLLFTDNSCSINELPQDILSLLESKFLA